MYYGASRDDLAPEYIEQSITHMERHRKELRHLHQKVKEKGLTIAAVKLYINDEGLAKLRIALARGKKEFDKRQTIKEKDIRREMERGE